MNRLEKIQFIRHSHPKLYIDLKEKIEDFGKEWWRPTEKELKDYNKIVAEYCKENCNNDLAKMLSLP